MHLCIFIRVLVLTSSKYEFCTICRVNRGPPSIQSINLHNKLNTIVYSYYIAIVSYNLCSVASILYMEIIKFGGNTRNFISTRFCLEL